MLPASVNDVLPIFDNVIDIPVGQITNTNQQQHNSLNLPVATRVVQDQSEIHENSILESDL